MDEQTAVVTKPFDIWEAWESAENIESVAVMPLDEAEGFMQNYERLDAERGRGLRGRIEQRRRELASQRSAVEYAAELVPAFRRGEMSAAAYFGALLEHPDVLPLLRESANSERTTFLNTLQALQDIGVDVGALRLKMLRDDDIDEKGEQRRQQYRFSDEATLMNLPPQEWLVEGVIPEDGLVVLFGAPGVGKSFVALDIALSIAYGTQWAGRQVKPGVVAYMAAEGGGPPFAQRVAAWKADKGLSSSENGRFKHGDAVQLLSADGPMALLEAAMRLPLPVRLIIVDTLARTTVGGEENSARDMGKFVESLELVRKYTGATIMVLHHETKGDGSLRGSTALPGAASTLAHLKEASGGVILSCKKQKDAAEFDDIALTPREVMLPSGGSSLVFDLGTGPVQAGGLTTQAQDVLTTLSDAFGGSPTTNGDLMEKVAARKGMSEGAFNRALKELVDAGYVEKTGRSKRTRYTLSMLGAGLLQSLQNAP